MKKQSKFGKKYSLTVLTCITALLAFIMLSVSVSTDNWLSTFERESDSNGTTVTVVHSGLWRECRQSQYLPGVTKKTGWSDKMKTFSSNRPSNCSYITYFADKPRGMAEIKPPEAILYDMQPAAFFPTTGLFGLFSGCILSFLSYCDQKVKKLIFVGGGLFVLSGIFMLVGIVLYVGSISQAFDSTAGNLDSEERYVYDYGGSFYFSVLSFILTEFSGIFAIYLYIAKHRHYLRIKREKTLTRSQSANSCLGLVTSASRYSFEAPSERLINSTELFSKRMKRERDISKLTDVEWCDPDKHWLIGNNCAKITSSTKIQSREKSVQLPTNGSNKPVLMSRSSNPITMFYEDEIGETSFGYTPRTEFTSNDSRVFYDSNLTTYYTDVYHVFEGQQNIVLSPAHNAMSTVTSPIYKSSNHNSRISSPKALHFFTSIHRDNDLPYDNIKEHNCKCAQTELLNHLPSENGCSLLTSPPNHVTLPKTSLLGASSRKITSV